MIMIVKTPMGSPAAAEEGGEEVGGRWEVGEWAWTDANFIAPHTSKQLNHVTSWCFHLCRIYIHVPLHIHMLPPLQSPLQWQRSLCEHRVVKVGLGKAVSNVCHMNHCNNSSTIQIIWAARQGTSAVTLIQRSTRHAHNYSTTHRTHKEDT